MTYQLSEIVSAAVAISDLLSQLMQQQPGNALLIAACSIAKCIDHDADELLISVLTGENK